MFTVGTAKAARGQTATGAIEVPAGSDAAMSIPVAVAHGAKAGPVLALLAGAHGTEYASIIALEKLIAGIDATQLSGTVIIVPLLNVPSFVKIVTHLNPTDGKNMNRMYPGRPDGTQTDRASHLITTQVVEQSDHVIDFHGGDIDESLRPYSVLESDRPRRPGRDLESDGPRVRSRSHRDLAESPARSGGVGVLREHRDDEGEAVDHRRSGSRRDGRGRGCGGCS